MTEFAPLTSVEFSELLKGMTPSAGESIAVAVSGGADSLALAILLGEWAKDHQVFLTALTVDHGLRPEAAAEARQVTEWLNRYDIPHVTLTWDGAKPDSNIQDEARRARYRLMGNWCREADVHKIFLAHHQGDQAETFLMRLLRGSGVEGLAAMGRVAPYPVADLAENREICRPLLTVAKARLTATLTALNQMWIEDPSNQNESYTRVRVRRLLEESDLEGLTVERMAQTAGRMGRVNDLLRDLIDDLARAAVTFYPEGYGEIDLALLREAHDEIALRLLARVIRQVSGAAYAPRFSKLEALYERLQGDTFKGQTLGGCRVSLSRGGRLLIRREAAAITDEFLIAPGERRLWDGRFWVMSGAQKGRVRRLDENLWRIACEKIPALKKVKISKVVRDALPCLCYDETSFVLPHFIGTEEDGGFQVTFMIAETS
ncbi:tRNA lysidine(34) synthetase TilS [Paremcibacter congregatus]|uniref:tRNA(Ile)-lysidine synthase n=1 Tax=Paremcibacter congregatus TaxID=2043170 RepID=A0A2G4YWF2_9PROT|nr:tRNA lysidine(34) synthetase TilS [Paremcibacter congregatus]PHZ85756.1 tRNA lysidine(34) synthetase TilS [Paremcibacter congregatus]QDE26717.1 tRNA lysidine(34) synthetase TilS [Paremcibacter congregatus]